MSTSETKAVPDEWKVIRSIFTISVKSVMRETKKLLSIKPDAVRVKGDGSSTKHNHLMKPDTRKLCVVGK